MITNKEEMLKTITIDNHQFPILQGRSNYSEWKKELMNYILLKNDDSFKRAIYGFSFESNELSDQMKLQSCSPKSLHDAHQNIVEIIYLTLDDGPYSISVGATNANRLFNQIEQRYSS